MSTQYKYQEQFAATLAKSWMDGKHDYVRTTIRTLKNKAQAAYIAADIALNLDSHDWGQAIEFLNFIHPNEGRS